MKSDVNGVEMEVEAVKIIGVIKGTTKKVELLLSAEDFYVWKDKIKKLGEKYV